MNCKIALAEICLNSRCDSLKRTKFASIQLAMGQIASLPSKGAARDRGHAAGSD
jgi:hypothetical protein